MKQKQQTRNAAQAGDDYRREAAEAHKEKSEGKTFKLAEGDNTLRLLPREASSPKRAPFYRYMQHDNVGPTGKEGFVRCGKNIQGEGDCWLCDDMLPRMQKSPKEQHKLRAERMKAKEKFIMQVAYMDQDLGKFRGPVLWYVPAGGRNSVAVQILGYLKNPKVELIDAQKGHCISITRTGTGPRNTRYQNFLIDPTPRPLPDKFLAKIKPFEEFISEYSEAHQKAKYYGRDEEEEDSGLMPENEAEAAEEALEPGDDLGMGEEPEPENNDTTEDPDLELGDDSSESEDPTDSGDDFGDFGEEPAKPAKKPAAKQPAKPAAKPTAKTKAKPPVDDIPDDDSDIPF